MQAWQFFTSNEIKPAGWLKKQLQIQARGLSGNLDKVWRDIKDSAWIGGSAEGWERVPYWLDGFIPLAYLLEDSDLISRAKKYMDAIIGFQQEDGWICPCKQEARKEYDPWAILLISKVLTVYYQCSKEEKAYTALYRAVKNLYELLEAEEIRLINWGKFRWFEGFIALNFLWKKCHEEWLKALARLLKEQGADYLQFTPLWKAPRREWRLDTHIVNIVMALKYEAVSCPLLDAPYLDIAEEFYNKLTALHGTPVGLFTGDECLAGLSPIRGTELCSVVELMYSYEQLFAYTGDKKWLERLEVVALNALPATVSDDMWAHQYDQTSNQIACQKLNEELPCHFATNAYDAQRFGLEPNFGCCTANFHQGFPKLTLSTFMHKKGAVINTLPLPSVLRSKNLQVEIITDYPFKNQFVYTLSAKKKVDFFIRTPAFAEKIFLNGKQVRGEIRIPLQAGEKRRVQLRYEVTPRFEERPFGLYAVKYGSLVFSVPIPYIAERIEYEQNGVLRKYPYCDYDYLPKEKWGWAYTGNYLTVEEREVGDTPFSSIQPPIILKAKVIPLEWGSLEGNPSICSQEPISRQPIGDSVEKELYPYGCAKLRMTEIPKI